MYRCMVLSFRVPEKPDDSAQVRSLILTGIKWEGICQVMIHGNEGEGVGRTKAK